MARRSGKDDRLKKTVLAGIHGPPELRPDEKRRFLGFFRERVIEAVTFGQIRTKEGREAITTALKDSRAARLVIHQEARSRSMALITEAQKKGVPFTVVSDPTFRGEVAVLVAANDAADVPRLKSES